MADSISMNANDTKRPLIILACGGAKVETRAAAVALYKGRQYGEFRKLGLAGDLATDPDLGFDLMVLSAEHGLVMDIFKMDPYDRKMNKARADELAEDEFQLFLYAMHALGRDEVFVYGGELYRDVIGAWSDKLVTMAEDQGCPMPALIWEVLGDGRGCGDHYSCLQGLLATLT